MLYWYILFPIFSEYFFKPLKKLKYSYLQCSGGLRYTLSISVSHSESDVLEEAYFWSL